MCADGQILFENIAWYRPKPLLMRHRWVSPQSICLRDLDAPFLEPGRKLGYGVLEALGFQSGFAHMEWFRTPDGEAVFGEIGARPPGARLVHAMNFSADVDLFPRVGPRRCAPGACTRRRARSTTPRWCSSALRERAPGSPASKASRGVLARYGEHVVNIDLAPVGAARKDHQKVVVGDGWIVARHPNLEVAMEIADALANEVRVVAG